MKTAADRLKQRAVQKAYYDRNTAKQCQKSRGHRFKQKYWPHLTIKQALAEWNRMYEEQKGLCSICIKLKPLEVEHCHKTGKVRSLACNGCNTALARINEEKIIAYAIIAYIEKHNETDN